MIRRLAPYLIVILAVMLDISVVPVFLTGWYVLPLTMLFVICTGFLLGRVHGMLIGMIGGLLTDILSSMPLGYMMAAYIAFGYLAGLLGFDSDEARAVRSYSRVRSFFKRLFISVILMGIFEAVTMVYQYFNTALFDWEYVRCALMRMGLCAGESAIMYYLALPVLAGTDNARVVIGARREVRNL